MRRAFFRDIGAEKRERGMEDQDTMIPTDLEMGALHAVAREIECFAMTDGCALVSGPETWGNCRCLRAARTVLRLAKVGGTSGDWGEDCLRYRGAVLTGQLAHWCHDWDGLPVDETTEEIKTCTCWTAGEKAEAGVRDG